MPSSAVQLRLGIANAAREGKVWIRSEKRAVSYAELDERVGQIAAVAAKRGLAIGDRVVIATRDDSEAALLFAALVLNGLTAVNLDPDTGAQRASVLVERASPALVILDAEIAAKWTLPERLRTVEIARAAPARKGLLGGLLKPRTVEGLDAELDQAGRADPVPVIPDETLAYILFTSGTTQQPKGVCISHKALFSHLDTLSRIYGYSSDSQILNTLMLSHADGMIQGPVIAFYNQATLHRPVKFEISAIERLLDSVYQLRITHMIAVPTMLSLMVRLSRNQDDAFQGGDFQLMVSCGAALEASLWEAVEAKFGVRLLNVYGLTETVVGGVFAGEVVGASKPGSIGRPVDCELKIIADDGQEVAEGQAGELLMRGNLLMSGYFEAPDLTREVMEPDGWFHTGDIAMRSEDGLYAICGRKKNIVIRGGLNIHPEEVAEALNRHPAVREAVAFGMPDADWGERLVAAVAAGGLSEEALLQFCAEHLEPRKVPSRILIVEELPKGRSGKVVIDEARALLNGADQPARTNGGAVAPADAETRLLGIAARCFRMDPGRLSLSTTPQDVLGWDSLAHMEFIVAVEQEFGLSLTPREVIGIDRLDKVLALVSPAR